MAEPSGTQIAFLIFAVWFLSIPLSGQFIRAYGPWLDRATVANAMMMLTAVIAIGVFRGVRAATTTFVSQTIPRNRRIEVLAATVAKLAMPLAFAGGVALWHFTTDSPVALENWLSEHVDPARDKARALSWSGITTKLLLAGLIAPWLEEILFRGFLFRAWERRWGWAISAVLTSAVFAAYHTFVIASFFASIFYICLYRRTGTLRAPIFAHCVYNVMQWQPLLGQFAFPPPTANVVDLAGWVPQMIALAFVCVALPVYVWIAARHPAIAR